MYGDSHHPNTGRSTRSTLPFSTSRNTSMNLGVEARCEALTCGPWEFGGLLAMNTARPSRLRPSGTRSVRTSASGRFRALQMNRGLVGSISTGSVTFGFGCVKKPATSDHLAIHPLPTRAATSVSTQASNSWGTWLGSPTISVTSAPSYAQPWYVLLLERSINSVILRLELIPARYLDSGNPEQFHSPSRRASTKCDRQQSHSRASTGCFVSGCLMRGGLVCDMPGPWLRTYRFARCLDV